MSQAFQNDLAVWLKPVDKNESALRDYARALCHKVNGESDPDNLYWGLMAEHSNRCDKTTTAMIDESVKNHQIPTDEFQKKAYEARLSVQVCTAPLDDSVSGHFVGWLERGNPAPQRLACFQAADGLYGGVPKNNFPGCTQEQLQMAVPSYLLVREAFSGTIKNVENYVAKFAPGADCYKDIFTQAAKDSDEASSDSSIQNQAVQSQTEVLNKIGWHDKDKKEF